jgi:hypothetical protein
MLCGERLGGCSCTLEDGHEGYHQDGPRETGWPGPDALRRFQASSAAQLSSLVRPPPAYVAIGGGWFLSLQPGCEPIEQGAIALCRPDRTELFRVDEDCLVVDCGLLLPKSERMAAAFRAWAMQLWSEK